MKKTLSVFIMAFIAAMSAGAAVNIPLTMANYDVFYHWGLINKLAGHGYASYQASGGNFTGKLNGHSIPWGGRIYTVNSSLNCRFQPASGGASEEIVRTEQGKYLKPLAGRNPETAKYKTIYGAGTLNASPETMEAVEIMSDMISIFYYAQELPFAEMAPGHSMEIPIRRDGVEQTLYITYSGTDKYSYNGFSCPVYDITFRYTYNGRPDKYPVRCLIDTRRLIPVQFSAKILIGMVEMKYVP